MSGPAKFLNAFSAYGLQICAGIAAWRIGGGATSTTLIWFGALGTMVCAIVFQSEWPRNSDGSFMSTEEALKQPKPSKGRVRGFFSGIAVFSVPVSLAVGLLAKCTGN